MWVPLETLYSLKPDGNVFYIGAYNVPFYYNIINVFAMPYSVSGIKWKQILDKYNFEKYNGISFSGRVYNMPDTIAFYMLSSYNFYTLTFCDMLHS